MAKKFKNGLVLGKLMPITMGHKFLIDEAVKQCKKVYVMMCSRECEPIPGDLRYTWLRKIYKDNPSVKIIHCKDENPQYPHEDINFWDIWYASVYSHIKKLDAVFTSEDYGAPFAKCLGVENVLVDRERKSVPISATMIREDPHKYWDFIPKVVRPYYTKKIVVVGPESTGKSTMVKKIAKKFDIPYVEEYGREYTDSIGDRELVEEDFVKIAMVHSDRIREGLGKKFLIVDTEAITTQTFAQLYIGESCYPHQLIEYIDTQYFDLWLVMQPDIPWDNDGTRDFPHKREKHFQMIMDEVYESTLDYKKISGVGKARTKMAYDIIKSFMKHGI
jgi:HTH-type transcriptional repressor of NAD biosynthesis genes